ncbi:MAG: hypothetical protein NPIRA01_25830 [Nitrospirales bacterium]|nr:MAG: hypothetical protein NPIRA01_25830 [Nitrospirales bacterium]
MDRPISGKNIFSPSEAQVMIKFFLSSSAMMAAAFFIFFSLIALSVPGHALETEPHPLDTFLDHVLDFQEPTGIRGKLRYIEVEEEIIWLDWEARSDDGPFFKKDWQLIPSDSILAVHPTAASQFEKLQALPKGTPLELIIKDDGKGHRHILSFHDMTTPSKVPI